MYRELLSDGAYNNAIEYAQLLALAKTEYEEEVAKEKYEREAESEDEKQRKEQQTNHELCR